MRCLLVRDGPPRVRATCGTATRWIGTDSALEAALVTVVLRQHATRAVQGRPPSTIDVPADDGSTCRYCLARWNPERPSAM
jgi:hypothetical protein